MNIRKYKSLIYKVIQRLCLAVKIPRPIFLHYTEPSRKSRLVLGCFIIRFESSDGSRPFYHNFYESLLMSRF